MGTCYRRNEQNYWSQERVYFLKSGEEDKQTDRVHQNMQQIDMKKSSC